MKKFFMLIVCVISAALILTCGCVRDGLDGRDGKDAQDVSIYDIYEAAKQVDGNENLTFDDFLKQYLSYSDAQLAEYANLQTRVNRSLMSGVSILTRFTYSRSRAYVYTGSGAILWLDKEAGDAYVVTNCHVVYDDSSNEIFSKDVRLYLYGQDVSGVNFVLNRSATMMGDENYTITNDDNYRIDAEVIGASVTYDIALLKVSGSEVLKQSDAKAASFSKANDVVIGQYVYAIGNAESEGMSATFGIVSKDSEYIEVGLSDLYEDKGTEYRVLRTTAPINHGNSGGAMYNTDGEIIAIVNAKTEGEDIDNMGYALPASNVRRLLGLMYDNYVSNGYKMKSGGGVEKAYLNIQTTISRSYAMYNNETGIAEITELVKISTVNGAPSRNYLNEGDILNSIKVLSSDGNVKEDVKIKRSYNVQDVLFSVRMGDKVIINVERSGVDTDVVINFDSQYYFKSFE